MVFLFVCRKFKEKGRSCNSRALNSGSRTIRRNTHSIPSLLCPGSTLQPGDTREMARPGFCDQGFITEEENPHPINKNNPLKPCLGKRITAQPGGLI